MPDTILTLMSNVKFLTLVGMGIIAAGLILPAYLRKKERAAGEKAYEPEDQGRGHKH